MLCWCILFFVVTQGLSFFFYVFISYYCFKMTSFLRCPLKTKCFAAEISGLLLILRLSVWDSRGINMFICGGLRCLCENMWEYVCWWLHNFSRTHSFFFPWTVELLCPSWSSSLSNPCVREAAASSVSRQVSVFLPVPRTDDPKNESKLLALTLQQPQWVFLYWPRS